ncbi:LytR family transcriptional attenuator [Geodermatophilus tzadiensis]|uniref:LytR family transcriptional attenuator n=1 Tax=Geodermatophilus tzadiensis TaxID=1137988 RepID=A0A2T0TS32_9ACTN|nr:LCP family protein [Geodermatophilus tzadiensis]PRY48532.1 LytR family transcriptional attenuator [Geodermatophilus tzadiensis]
MTRDEDGASADRPLPARLDPRAGRPAHGHGAGKAPQQPAPRTRRGVVVARAVAAVLSVVLLGASGWGWYLTRVAEATVTRTDAIPDSGNADAEDAAEATNLLLVGNDSRADLTPEQLEEFSAGTDSGTNTDTMILAHIPADGSGASFVSFPRDSYVEIPGHGTDKLNAAYAYGYGDVDDSAPEEERRAGGRQLLVQTISGLTGLMIDHYAEVDLLGFFELSSVVGGVEVNLCSAVDDSAYSGAVFDAGVQTIEGADALAFVRQRHGVRPDGSPALPRGDLDRIVRQQVFIGGVLRKILSQDTLLDLGTQRRLIEAASRSLTIDDDLDLLDLAQHLQAVRLDAIRFQTVPIADADAEDDDGRSIVRLADAATLRAFFASLSAEPEPPAAGAPATVAPSEVSVEVYNGSGIPGLAADATADLEAAGFVVTSTGNAATSDHEQTVVRYAPGDEALADTLVAAVPGAVPEVSDEPEPGTVQLVLGYGDAGSGGTEAPSGSAAPTEEPRTAEDTGCIN